MTVDQEDNLGGFRECAKMLAEAAKQMPIGELTDILRTKHVYRGKKPELVQQLMNEAAQVSEQHIANILRSCNT